MGRVDSIIDLDAKDAYRRDYSLLITVALLAWEMIIMFEREYKHIWRAPRNLVRSAYLASRYLGLCLQTVSLWLSFLMHSQPVSQNMCRVGNGIQIGASHIMLGIMEFILMLRVYALYNKSLPVGFFLAVLFMVKSCYALAYWGIHLPTMPTTAWCVWDRPPASGVIFLAGSSVVVQCVIWSMTLRKIGPHAVARDTLSNAALVHLLLRDGSFVLICVCSFTIASATYAFFGQAAAHIVLPMYTGAISVATCRIIINMQSLKVDPTVVGDIALTSYLGVESRRGPTTSTNDSVVGESHHLPQGNSSAGSQSIVPVATGTSAY